MKQAVSTIAIIAVLQIALTASAQQVNLRVPNFARPLVEKWVAEYQKTNDVNFEFVTAKSQNLDNTIALTTDERGVKVARYAVLPVTVKGSEAARLIGRHGLNAKKLKSLFFVEDELDDEADDSEAARSLHILTGNSQLSASRLYATHFHQEVADYKGKKISGDDSFLNQAISRDPLAVTVNSLSNIYDLESRQLSQKLTLLPLDLDKEGRQVLSEGRLDDVLRLLERAHYQEIPVGTVGLDYDHSNAALARFVDWVLSEGTQYVHQYGLLSIN